MSLRFNPVAFLTRRRSRSKSKTRTKPGTTSGSPPGQNNGLGQQETAIEPRITTKPARTSGTSPRRASPRPYFRVFSSFRRTRSPRRPADTKNVDSPARAESVPPGRSSPLVFESKQPEHTQEPQAADDGTKSPAPLAQSDCFELTDVSDPEVEEVSARMRQHNAQESLPERSTEDDSEQVTESSRSETDIQSVIERIGSRDFDEEKSIDESTKYEKSEDEDEDTCIDTPDTAVYDDEQSVTKLSVEYETEYPVCERDSDSTISAHGSQLEDEWVVTDEKEMEKSSSSEEDERSDFHISSSEQSSHEQEEEDGQGKETVPSLTVQLSEGETEKPEIKLESPVEEEFEIHKTSPGDPSNLEGIETNLDYQNGSHSQHEESGLCEEETAYVHEENGEVDYIEPQFEVTHDPAQDPFHEVELAATERSWDNSGAAASGGELSVPSIIVTSASSLSLNQQAESEPPERPPPPAVAPPQRPPPPPTGPPPRPPGSPTHGQTGETGKKRKLFGVVDVGPLPSDPDPNFPFRKHLEKSIVPNPKKAIQRIIRGETKAERRQRKEQDELNRLLKSKANTDVKPVDAHSKDWEFFQELTAQIEHTVQESASKVKVLLPSKPHPLEEDDEEEEDQGEDWAHFDSAFGSETEPAAVQTFNPWEDQIKPAEVSEEFDLEPEGAEGAQHDGDMTDTLVQISDEPEHSGLNEVEQQSLTDLERDLGTEAVSEDTATGLTKDIDTFLGIEATNEPNYQEPLSSDPLQILECLKPKNEVDPLEELGLGLNPSTGMATDVVNDPTELALADFSSDVQQGSDNSLAESIDASEPNELQQPDTNRLGDAAELGARETQYEDTSSKKQAIELPYQEDMDRSDVEDSTAVDDVLWGGFGEIHVEPNGHEGSEPDPFGLDDFGSALANYGNGAQPGSRKEANLYEQPSKDAIRPRAKPVRQETLSGNNPFRKRNSEDNEPDDELIRAAASIGLIGLQHTVRKHRDSFESSGSSLAEDNLGNEQSLQVAGEIAEEVLTDDVDHIENAKVPTLGFDPLQTIYPESDNESVASEEQTQTENQAISITIKDKPEVLNGDETRSSPEVPTLTAPPSRPPPVAVEPKKAEPELISMNAEAADEPVARHPTPVGWVNFNSESAEILDETDKQLVPAELTFEVDWSAPVIPPQRTEPEPPRPDTPDPELDIPFYPVAKDGAFYRLWLRYPEKKTRIKQVSKYTTDRYWREIAICFRMEHGRKVIDIHEIDEKSDVIASEPYRSIRIEPYMQLSREKLQQYDKYGKLHVFKLNHVTYREMVGIRPEKFSIKSLQNLVTHKPKQNVAVDHLPIYTEILKFGSLDQKKIRELMCVFEDALMQIPAHKDTSLTYNREEVCCYVVDEYQAHVSAEGIIKEQKARTRILCTAFVNGGPHIVLGLNDKWRYGREVVRRSDILPVMHDEWISIRCPEFHSCVELDAYEIDHMLKFFPLDGCRFELLRFRVSLRGNKELPMQVRTTYGIDGRRVSMRCELLVPGFFSASNRKGAVACENVEIHIPVPEDWIYHFRVEKHHKYGSVHSTLRKPGRIKGLERITQMAQSLLPPSILEASIGLAKYEHLYKAIVWRIPRIPEKHEASLRPHLLTCKLTLAQHDTVPEWDTLIPECQVEYTMPSSTVSGATVRSISVEHTGVAEKFVKYTSKYKYTVDIDYHLGERKEPPLKSMLDDQESPVEQEIEEPPQVETPVAEEQVEEPQGTEVADLLGLGFGFSDLSENQTADTKEPQETPGSADLL